MNPLTGPLYLLKGFGLIRRPGLRRFVLVPLGVNVALFSAGIYLAVHYFDATMAQLLPEGYEWLEWLLWPLFAIALLLTMFYTFTLVANFICAPFNGLLAEAVERELRGEAHTGSGTLLDALREVPKSLWVELKKLGYFLSRAVPLLLLFLIPGLNLFAPLLWALFSAHLLASEYFDYPMANRGIPFEQQRKVLKENRLTSLGFGGAVMVVTMIPVLNFIAMPSAVAGATALYLERIEPKRKNNDENQEP